MSKAITAKDVEKVEQFHPRPAQEKWLDTAVELISTTDEGNADRDSRKESLPA